MKVCDKCGIEIYTVDGDNTCTECRKKSTAKKTEQRKRRRQEHDDLMSSLGLIKVKGAYGGVYWE